MSVLCFPLHIDILPAPFLLYSYDSDVDIDTEVKPAITAGVKGLKVSACCSSVSSTWALRHGCCSSKNCLNFSAPGDAEGHFRASYRSSTAGWRRHHFFHSPPRECSSIYTLVKTAIFGWSFCELPSLFKKNLFSFQTLQINWTGMTNLLDTPAFRLVFPENPSESWATFT